MPELKYKLKINYSNKNSDFLGDATSTPKNLRYSLDGLIPWDIYNKTMDEEISTQELIALI